MKLIYFLFLLVILGSCSGDSLPKEIIPPTQMQDVLWDYLRADVYTTDFIVTDSTKNAVTENIRLQKIVFAKHKVSKQQFYKSYNYYLEHPELMTQLLDSMMAMQNRKQINISDSILQKREKPLKNLKVM
ncbi:MAG: DUF4296 domain-containing protein [Ferruginibacter sp.]